jgi:hypothetical protein
MEIRSYSYLALHRSVLVSLIHNPDPANGASLCSRQHLILQIFLYASLCNINGGKASNFQAPFGLIGTIGPIPAKPGCFLPGFTDVTWIKGNGISAAPLE